MCLNPLFLRLLYISKIVINILRFVVPIALIFKTLLDIYKQVFNPNDKEGMNLIKNRIIAAIIIFIVPTIVNVLVDFTSKVSDTNIKTGLAQCLEFADMEHINAIEDEIYKSELESNDEIRNSNLSDYDKVAEAVRIAIDKSKTNNSSNDNNGGNSNSSSNTSNIIFVGDSRTRGMCNNLSLDNCVAKDGEAIDWFNNTAIGEANKILNANSDKIYNIIIDLGVNNLSSKKYAIAYNNLKKGSWSKHNIIVVSVTPVDENKYKTIRNFNSKIVSFNNNLKANLDSSINYCDIYSKVLKLIQNSDDITISDGLHYTKKGYMEVYNYKKACIN